MSLCKSFKENKAFLNLGRIEFKSWVFLSLNKVFFEEIFSREFLHQRAVFLNFILGN